MQCCHHYDLLFFMYYTYTYTHICTLIHTYTQHETVQPGERLPLIITVRDQVNNSREAIWSLDGPHGDSVCDIG